MYSSKWTVSNVGNKKQPIHCQSHQNGAYCEVLETNDNKASLKDSPLYFYIALNKPEFQIQGK